MSISTSTVALGWRSSLPSYLPISVGGTAAALISICLVFRERISDLALQNHSIEYFVLATSAVLLLLGLRCSPMVTSRDLRDLFPGVLLIAAGLSGLLLLDWSKRPIVSSTPVLIAMTVAGTVWALFGFAEARRQIFPVGYLLCMTPLPVLLVVAIDLPLQLLSTALACNAANLLGIPAQRWGTTVRLQDSQVSLRIIGDCNGLRSAIAISAITLLLGWLLQASFIQRVLLLGAGVVFAYAGNILRLTTILALLSYFGEKFVAVLPRFEEWYGAAIFAAALGLLYLTARWMGCTRFREI